VLVIYARGDTAAANVNLLLRFNGDSGANYDYQSDVGQGSSSSGTEVFAATSIVLGVVPAASAGANLAGAAVVWLPNYAGTTFNKTSLALAGAKWATTSLAMYNDTVTGNWRSSSAITQMTVSASAGNLVTGTRASLYAFGA
jgi:hypothetical protein